MLNSDFTTQIMSLQRQRGINFPRRGSSQTFDIMLTQICWSMKDTLESKSCILVRADDHSLALQEIGTKLKEENQPELLRIQELTHGYHRLNQS